MTLQSNAFFLWGQLARLLVVAINKRDVFQTSTNQLFKFNQFALFKVAKGQYVSNLVVGFIKVITKCLVAVAIATDCNVFAT
jgi:hypothetical protein